MVLALGLAASAAARADEYGKPCEPACGAGQTCVDGVCMVPAAPPTAPMEAAPANQPPALPEVEPPSSFQPQRPAPTGLLVLPYAGLNIFRSDGGSAPDAGLRLGTLLGGRVNELFSANGEVTFDVINLAVPAGVTASEYMFHFTFSPLLHFRSPGAELVIGPKIGGWILGGHSSGPETYGYVTTTASADIEARGWTVGLNAGAFLPISDRAGLGVLVSYARLRLTHSCVTVSGSSAGQACRDSGDDLGVIGLHVAALF
jgi:hypothetical protein